jgi:hypothetical protein
MRIGLPPDVFAANGLLRRRRQGHCALGDATVTIACMPRDRAGGVRWRRGREPSPAWVSLDASIGGCLDGRAMSSREDRGRPRGAMMAGLSRFRLDRMIGAILGALCMLAVTLPARAKDEVPLGVHWVDGYVPRFAQKREMNARYRTRIDAMHQQILARNLKGEDLPCSSQIMEEVTWLVNYTTRTADVEGRLQALQESLALSGAEQAVYREQSPADGSFGGCFGEWFLRLHTSVDPLKELVRSGGKLRYPLRILDAVNSPEKIVALFERLLVSRPLIDGVDRRKELNLTVTALGQLLFLPELAPVFPERWPRAEVAAALIRFMDERWQDPATGYWGAWYDVDGKLTKTEDLSITFHIASYRRGEIANLQRLVRTTYLNRTKRYPYGWQDRGSQNCHHAYDVIRLIRFGWPHMSEMEKAYAQAQIIIILARALRFSVNADGEFDASPYNRVAEAYYFGVSLLDEIGFFRRSKNFWSDMEFSVESEPLRERILAQLDSSIASDPMIQAARHKLLARD